MKIPIKGYIYRVKMVEQINDPDLGVCDAITNIENKRISIDKNNTSLRIKKLHFHEILHAIVKECRLIESGGLSEEAEEILAIELGETLGAICEFKTKRKKSKRA